MLSWQDWVCKRVGYRYYDLVLEDFTEEELAKLEDEYDEYVMDFYEEMDALSNEYDDDLEDNDDYVPSSTNGDYSPSNPWDAPGMSIHDFI